jgi:hypothetical protein
VIYSCDLKTVVNKGCLERISIISATQFFIQDDTGMHSHIYIHNKFRARRSCTLLKSVEKSGRAKRRYRGGREIIYSEKQEQFKAR